MDRKSIIVLAVSFVLMLSWFKISERLFPPVPAPETNSLAFANSTATNSSGTNVTGAGEGKTTPDATNAAVVSAANRGTQFVAAKGTEETLAWDTPAVRYTFTSHGGGLKQVELKQEPETFGDKATAGRFVTLNAKAPVPILALLGPGGLQDDAPFKLTRTDTGVRAEKALPNGIYLIKDFQPTSNYLVKATVRLENRSGQPVALREQEWVIGTSTPITPRDAGQAMGFQWYNGDKTTAIGQSWFANRTLGCFPGTPRELYDAGENNVSWGGVYNQFYTVVAMPAAPAAHISGRMIKLPPPPADEVAADSRTVKEPFGFQAALVYPPTIIGAQGTNNVIQREITLYAGPKEYKRLARLGNDFNNRLDLVMGFDTGFGGRFSGFFAKALLLGMNGLHKFGLPYAWCIISITVIIKLLFWPLTRASTRSMKRMQELQPQMKALQDKYKDDPAKSQQKLMEFMKENKVSPLGGCLPMLLQFPVFIGFFTMIRTAIELRGAQFFWAHDLSQADTVAHIMGFPLNPLPIMMAATMLWQARLTPASPGMDPAQQKMMKYMPMLIAVGLYNFSAGLTLYYTVQNLLSITQTKLTKTYGDKAPPAGKPAPAAREISPGKKKK